MLIFDESEIVGIVRLNWQRKDQCNELATEFVAFCFGNLWLQSPDFPLSIFIYSSRESINFHRLFAYC